MHRTRLVSFPLVLLLTLATASFGLTVSYSREEVGPAKEGKPSAGPESAFRHSPFRCYWRESGFDGWGMSNDEVVTAFRGDVDAANAALLTFATLPAKDKVVRLFPGPGSVRSADSKVMYPCDWEVRWSKGVQRPRGARKETSETSTAVLTLYIGCAEPVRKMDPRVGRWIKELDDDSYRAREDASRALAEQGVAALPSLRAAMEGKPSTEQRRRIGRLLDRLKLIHVARLILPKGIRLTCLDELVKEAEKEWRSGDLARTWQAIPQLAEWAEYSEDTFPMLVEALLDQREQVRGQAEHAFVRLGERGAAALARLRAADARSSASQESVRKAIRAIGEATDKARVKKDWEANRRLRAEISDYCRTLAK